jgi:hypothetical protein
MSQITIAMLAALLAQGGLALVLLWLLGARRLPLIGRGKIRIADIAMSREPWPDDAKLASNAFDNQFQLPVLFYVAVFAALYLGPVWFEAALAWGFVISRIVHAAIHVTSNHVIRRFTAYVTGYAILIVFLLELAVRLVLSAFASA